MIFKTPYSGNSRLKMKFSQESLTDQSFKEECDIGFIISNFVRTGQQLDSTMSFVDCTTVQSFEDSMQIVAEAKSNFNSLPSSIRDEFKTVSNYLEYISDAKNLRDSYERGLIDRGSVNIQDVYPDLYNPNGVDISKMSSAELKNFYENSKAIKAELEVQAQNTSSNMSSNMNPSLNQSQLPEN